MGNESLIANLIAKCDQELDKKCEGKICKECKYYKACIKVTRLIAKFKRKGYINENSKMY